MSDLPEDAHIKRLHILAIMECATVRVYILHHPQDRCYTTDSVYSSCSRVCLHQQINVERLLHPLEANTEPLVLT